MSFGENSKGKIRLMPKWFWSMDNDNDSYVPPTTTFFRKLFGNNIDSETNKRTVKKQKKKDKQKVNVNGNKEIKSNDTGSSKRNMTQQFSVAFGDNYNNIGNDNDFDFDHAVEENKETCNHNNNNDDDNHDKQLSDEQISYEGFMTMSSYEEDQINKYMFFPLDFSSDVCECNNCICQKKLKSKYRSWQKWIEETPGIQQTMKPENQKYLFKLQSSLVIICQHCRNHYIKK